MSLQTDTADTQAKGRDLRDFVRMIRRYWLGEAVIVLATIGLVAGVTALQPRVYQSTATGLTQAATGESLSMAFAGESLAKSRAESYVRVATSDAVAKRAQEALGTDRSISDLLAHITATLPADTAIIEITASAGTPEAAAKLANAWSTALSEQVRALESPEGSVGDPAISFVPLANARAPYFPSSPNIQTALVLAVLAGCALALVYALLRQQFDRRIRSVEQIERLLDAPVIGTVPASPALSERQRVVEQDSTADSVQLFAISESLRELRTNLSYIDVDNPPKVIVVTSSIPGEGKSTLTANLADAIASSNQNVVIIDCDLRRPMQSTLFSLRGGVGLTDVLSGRVALGDALQAPSASTHLRVLGAGRVPPNPSELLGSRTMRELIGALSGVATVILDAPPLLSVTDAAILGTIADGVVIAVGAKQVTAEQLQKAYRSVTRVNGKVLGAVLNKIPPNGVDSHDYGYYRNDYYTSHADAAPVPVEARAAEAGGAETGATEPASTRREQRSRKALRSGR
ncbi:polysaccharide biosynthesis tyrosine autokinase [Leifsonia shinshuensis]